MYLFMPQFLYLQYRDNSTNLIELGNVLCVRTHIYLYLYYIGIHTSIYFYMSIQICAKNREFASVLPVPFQHHGLF